MGRELYTVPSTSSDSPETEASGGAPSAALTLVDHGGRILWMNERAAEILGQDPTSEEPRHQPSTFPIPYDQLRKAVDGPPLLFFGPSSSPPSSRALPTRITIKAEALSLPNLPGSLLLVMEDLNHRDQLQAERDRLLRLANEGEVLPAILHELKNPLAAVTAMMELLVEDSEGPLQSDLHSVLWELRRMSLTLQWANQRNREPSHKAYFSVDSALRHTCHLLESAFCEAAVEFSYALPNLPLLPMDPAVLSGLVFNLLRNALDATPKGGTVHFEASVDGSDISLSVQDTGKGMDPTELRRCKELFFTTKPSGTGVGLALCTEIAERSGGSLTIESTAGKGTRVFVRIPIPKKVGRKSEAA